MPLRLPQIVGSVRMVPPSQDGGVGFGHQSGKSSRGRRCGHGGFSQLFPPFVLFFRILDVMMMMMMMMMVVIRLSSAQPATAFLAWKPTTTTTRTIHKSNIIGRAQRVDYDNDDDDKDDDTAYNIPKPPTPTPPTFARTAIASRDVALAIVPPDTAWDRLQRARHYARDSSYTKWPPCLRLFHPFALTTTSTSTSSTSSSSSRSTRTNTTQRDNPEIDLALTVASVIDRYQIAPFNITLSEWSIIPHAEALEADLVALRHGSTTDYSETDDVPWETKLTDEERHVQQLIAQQEVRGRTNQIKRALKTGRPIPPHQQQRRRQASSTRSDQDSPRALWEKQRELYEEFNGPCVVCLEPDEASRAGILELRDLLLTEPHLRPFGAYSPTLPLSDLFPSCQKSIVAPRDDDDDNSYRPILPIAAFPTVTSAVEMARKLRQLWEPLSFSVTDLHLISTTGDNGDVLDPTPEEHRRRDVTADRSMRHIPGAVGSSAIDGNRNSHEEEQMGCDALIMLAGEELEMDSHGNEEMANLIAKEGYAGGFVEHNKKQRTDQSMQQHDDTENGDDNESLDKKDGETMAIYQWLDDDDEEDELDEGTVLVIGRTHFFTGEMRLYVGMPAMSQVDAKDQAFGTTISAAARRRGTVHRSGWKDGEWGKKEDDVSPWSKNERSKRQDRLNG